MAIYKTRELFDKLSELINDGIEYTEVTTCDADDDFPESLAFESIISDCEGESYDDVESCEVPEAYNVEFSTHSVSTDEYCNSLIFTYKEIFALMTSVDITLDHIKEIIDKPEYKKERSNLKSISVACRNLQAKFRKFEKTITVHE